MATSPPLEEKVNLYLIVSLPCRPGSFHYFFIYSASILDSVKGEIIKSLFDILTFLPQIQQKISKHAAEQVPA